jgi:haloalkane dehalogenase
MTTVDEFCATKRRVRVLDREMAYVERGTGETILFLHGNPTSSILWRDVIPQVESLGRCIAPDLIGMGDSDKLEGGGPSYRFVEHRRYLDELLDQLDVGDRVVLVVHDWGSALGFDWANRHRERVAGIAYMEGIVRPLSGWEAWPEAARRVFQGLRSESGESMILESNLFVERILPASILRDLTEDEMEAYRRPFAEPGEGRWPTLQWPREIPIGGEPADVAEIVGAYAAWLSESDVPKLFINAEPGSILIGDQREFCRSWPNQREVTVKGLHFVQEDSGNEIGRAVAEWYQELQVGGSA